MKLRDYLQTLSVSEREAFAERAGTKASYLPHIADNRHRRVSTKLARRLVEASDGALTLAELRPDVWGDDKAA